MTMTATRERPMIFSGPMVQAIMAGRKTQTRRVIKPQPTSLAKSGLFGVPVSTDDWAWPHPKRPTSCFRVSNKPDGPTGWADEHCPFGKPGDRLWVRENWWHHKSQFIEQAGFMGGTVTLLEDGYPGDFHRNDEFDPAKYPLWKSRSPIHMPHWASRITLEVTEVRVQRVQEISESDCLAEGIQKEDLVPDDYHPPGHYGFVSGLYPFPEGKIHVTATEAYRELWDKLNPKTPWESNPWVWAITFRVLPALT